MKTRMVALILMVMSVLLVSGQSVQAQIRSESVAALPVDALYTGLSAGSADSALAAFTEDATVQNRRRGTTYSGRDEVAAMLAGWHKPGRQYHIRVRHVTNLANGLDLITSDVELSDHGVLWGRETLMAVVQDGKIQRLYVTARLRPEQYW